MKKCPLLKVTEKSDNNISSIFTESFQDCIGEECTAWDEDYSFCQYFSNTRNVIIRQPA